MPLPSALLSSLVAFGTQWPIIDLPYRTERVQLQLIDREWRVVPPEK